MRSKDEQRRVCGACCTQVEHLGVRFGRHQALEDVNLHMHCGQLMALIGPNGAGKTTLLRALLGDVTHTGAIRFMRLTNAQGRAVRPVIGYVPQRMEFDPQSPATVADLFAASCSRRPVWAGLSATLRPMMRAALERTGGGAWMERRIGELSPGQLQRVLLALALTPPPNVLLLDEPVAGIDPGGVERFYQTVSGLRCEYDLSVLLISHDLPAVARVADRIIFLDRTIVCDGPPARVLASDVVREAFGFDYSGQLALREPIDTAATFSPAHATQEEL